MSQLAMLAQMTVAVLTAMLPTISSWGAVPDEIINLLVQLLRIAVDEADALVTPIGNIISVLKASNAVTPAQFTALQAMLDANEAAFEAAAKAAGA